jgi:molybdopterin-binding protein
LLIWACVARAPQAQIPRRFCAAFFKKRLLSFLDPIANPRDVLPPAFARHLQEVSMKLSARNQLKGKIVNVQKGQTTGHVRIEIGNGVVITSSITNEAIDELGLKTGDEAIAVIKASDVMVAK